MSVINSPFRYEPGTPSGFYRSRELQRLATNLDNVDPETGEIMPSMTRQSDMAGCDIHNILKQFSQVGFETLVRERAAQGQYADLTSLPDYQTSLNIVLDAQNAFAALPSQVRDRFQNDPSRFLEFLQDPRNQDEAIKLGLAQDTRTPEAPPQKVEIVNPPDPNPAK